MYALTNTYLDLENLRVWLGSCDRVMCPDVLSRKKMIFSRTYSLNAELHDPLYFSHFQNFSALADISLLKNAIDI